MKQNLHKKITEEKQKYLIKNQKDYLLFSIKNDIFNMLDENLSIRKIHKILTNASIKISYSALLKFIKKETKDENNIDKN